MEWATMTREQKDLAKKEALEEVERRRDMKFVKVRKKCPWVRTRLKNRKPMKVCKATDNQCSPKNCALWHLLKEI